MTPADLRVLRHGLHLAARVLFGAARIALHV